ncbi:hypothetical protein J8273_6660 [Carpediemonas membranifera]|uniref:Uncharacterized protein n=1 Tax=Carpediemonas membranifera TaxID=201153 RepID=A0A8J6B3B6_9EUKA|nr:hypothetical protein J8273_6660 [Carpediemonas membranifera]|eukprot:KAG9392069.1 hypothetical protein J8273_6660 [Carpediemonas membranifera]
MYENSVLKSMSTEKIDAWDKLVSTYLNRDEPVLPPALWFNFNVAGTKDNIEFNEYPSVIAYRRGGSYCCAGTADVVFVATFVPAACTVLGETESRLTECWAARLCAAIRRPALVRAIRDHVFWSIWADNQSVWADYVSQCKARHVVPEPPCVSCPIAASHKTSPAPVRVVSRNFTESRVVRYSDERREWIYRG